MYVISGLQGGNVILPDVIDPIYSLQTKMVGSGLDPEQKLVRQVNEIQATGATLEDIIKHNQTTARQLKVSSDTFHT